MELDVADPSETVESLRHRIIALLASPPPTAVPAAVADASFSASAYVGSVLLGGAPNLVVECDKYRLVHGDTELDDIETIDHYGIGDGDTLSLVLALKTGPPPTDLHATQDAEPVP
ncbi:hypothetical protein Pelo_3528 [Pelomyxa schiedti]|nr:hypothetical protein Pelo_3528 [Pelomyxa schiedti]